MLMKSNFTIIGILASAFLIIGFLGSKTNFIYQKSIDQFANDYKNYVTEQYGLKQIASGGEFMNAVHSIHFGFYKDQPTTVDAARILIIDLAQEYLRKVNQSKSLRPFLDHYPHDVYDISISCSFPLNLENQTAKNVSGITLSDGKIRYFLSHNSSNHRMLHSELYDEACALLDQTDSDEQ